MSRQLRFGPPPAALRKARLDNLALLPGSALAQIVRYQEMANRLPHGGVLIVLPAGDLKRSDTLLRVARLVAKHGHTVRVIRTELLPPDESQPPANR